MTPIEILDLKMPRNDAKAKTIRAYLKALLSTLWSEGEGFSGKRPFGNSGWEHDLYLTLVKGKAVAGRVEDGCACDYDEAAANKLIFAAIDAL